MRTRIREGGARSALAVLAVVLIIPARADYTLDWETIDGGGGTGVTGVYTLDGTIGQPDASPAAGGAGYTLTGGFWAIGGPDVVGPTSGTFALTPLSPVTPATQLTAEFGGWTGVNLPLSYEVRAGGNVIVPAGSSAAPAFSLAEGTHVLTGRIYDGLGRFTDAQPLIVVVDGSPPTGGTLAVTPPSPVMAGTLLTAQFADWTDASPPLTYEVREGESAIVPPGSDAAPTFVLETGAHELTGRIRDALGNVAEVGPLSILVDGSAPVIVAPSDITVHATSPAGAVVNFVVSASDDHDPNPSVVANPPSGSTFPLGTTSVEVTAQDAAGNIAAVQVHVTVIQAPPPDALLHAIPSPPVGVQTAGQLGWSTAIEGGLTVVGAPFDDLASPDSGAVKVFDTESGELLHVIPNPTPAFDDRFGTSVAISGTRVVVGTPRDAEPNAGVFGRQAAGAVHVFDLAASNPTPTLPVVSILNPSSTPGSEYFGTAVAIAGSRVAAGTEASDDSNVYVFDLNGANPTQPVLTLNNPGALFFDWFGTALAMSGSRLVVGADGEDTGASGAGSAYVYDLDGATPDIPLFTLHNPTPAVNDFFGSAVAISGLRVVIGAYQDDSSAPDAGGAYVYDLDPGNPAPTQPVATLQAPGAAAGDYFGFSVGISGGLVAVGAYSDDLPGQFDVGMAHVFDLDSGTPTVPLVTVNNPSPAAGDRFGYAVAISGTDLAVGATHDDTGSQDAGSAYLFEVEGAGQTTLTGTLQHQGPSSNDQFGSSVALSGKWLVVGAPFADIGGTDAGAAYVCDLASAAPTVPVFTLERPNPGPHERFGFAVAVFGNRVLVGAPGAGAASALSGVVYAYDLAGPTPEQPSLTLNNPSPAALDQFGVAVALSGSMAVVGATGDDTGALDAGGAYVFDLDEEGPPTPVVELHNPQPNLSDGFGIAVAIEGELVVVGVPFDDGETINVGRVFVFDIGTTPPILPVFTFNNPGPAVNENFGNAVGVATDDGVTRVVIGAHHDNGSSGRVYVHDLAAPDTPTVLSYPGLSSAALFGSAVAISGSRIVVGAIHDDTGADNAGQAFVYDFASVTPAVPVATLVNPDPLVEDRFGFALAIDGATIAVGTPLDDSPMGEKGSVYIFGQAGTANLVAEGPGGGQLGSGSEVVDFGSAPVGSAGGTRVFTLRNMGNATLSGLGVSLGGVHPADFQVATGNMAAEIGPGASTTFEVSFAPQEVGFREAMLQLHSSDPDESPFQIRLTGTGTAVVIPPGFASLPLITPATATTGARISAQVSGPPGATVYLEASFDLGLSDPWQVIAQLVLDDTGSGMFIDVEDLDSAGRTRNFFRLRTDQ